MASNKARIPRKTAAPKTPAAKPAPRKRKPRIADNDATVRKFATEAARLINDLHGTDVLLLDVRKLNDVTDYILIATGTSERQVRSLGDSIEELGVTYGMTRHGREVDGGATWYVLDLVDVVVHLFEPAARAHYDIEMLWGDAPRIRWRRAPGAPGSAKPGKSK